MLEQEKSKNSQKPKEYQDAPKVTLYNQFESQQSAVPHQLQQIQALQQKVMR